MNRSPLFLALKKAFFATATLWLLPAVLAAQSKPAATFAGSVVDSLQRPIANADVSLPAFSLSTVTDDRGAFRITGISAGVHRVVVRRIGYGQLDTVIVFPDSQTVQRRITLGRIVALDSVVAVDAPNDNPLLVEFEEHRKRGLGKFLTRADLDKIGGQTLGNVMQQMPGLAIIRGRSGQSWIAGKHAPMTRCPPTGLAEKRADQIALQERTDACLRSERLYYVPDEYETGQGMRRDCYAIVYLDRSIMNSGRPTTPFDLNSLAVARIEAIEWYQSAGEVPPTLNVRDSACGLAILHARRR